MRVRDEAAMLLQLAASNSLPHGISSAAYELGLIEEPRWPGPRTAPRFWRCRLARQLVLALRGVL